MHIYTTQSPYFQLIILYIVATLNVSDSDTHTHTHYCCGTTLNKTTLNRNKRKEKTTNHYGAHSQRQRVQINHNLLVKYAWIGSDDDIKKMLTYLFDFIFKCVSTHRCTHLHMPYDGGCHRWNFNSPIHEVVFEIQLQFETGFLNWNTTEKRTKTPNKHKLSINYT